MSGWTQTVLSEPDGAALLPSPIGARLIGYGQPTAAATWMWIHTTERAINGRATASGIRATLAHIGALDPEFQTPWVMGALMCERMGDIPTHQAVLAEAADRFPDEPWFPWARAMSHWVHDQDSAQASAWMERAGDIPGAPEIHARAAEAFRQ